MVVPYIMFPLPLFGWRSLDKVPKKAWAPERDSNWDSPSGAQLFLGTITSEKEPVLEGKVKGLDWIGSPCQVPSRSI